jgi:hypothetical protein
LVKMTGFVIKYGKEDDLCTTHHRTYALYRTRLLMNIWGAKTCGVMDLAPLMAGQLPIENKLDACICQLLVLVSDFLCS